MNRVGVKRSGEWAVHRFVMMRVLSLVVLVCGVFVCAGYAGDRIEDDAGVRRYGLRNGVEVIVIPRDLGGVSLSGGAGELQIWLVLDAGLVDERDDERGAMQICAELIRGGVGGVDSLQVSEMILTREEREQDPKRSQGVQVMLDHTVISGWVPARDEAAAGALLGYYAMVLDPSGWGTDDEAFRAAQEWLRERVEQVMIAPMRARQRWLPRILGVGTLGTRLDLPEVEEIDVLNADHVSALATRVIQPGNATVLVVGDVGGLDVDRLIADSIGALPAREGVASVDIAAGLGGDPIVFEQEPDWDQHQAALIWTEIVDSERDDLRRYIIGRVAEEVVRRRIERLGVAALGKDAEIAVDRFELGSTVGLMQWVIQRDGTDDASWNESVGLMISEGERLHRFGAGTDEIVQARGALLAGWHRDAVEWKSLSDRERARDYLWLTISDRRMISPVRWDEIATDIMSTIRVDEIDETIRTITDTREASVLVSRGGDRDAVQQMASALDRFVQVQREQDLAALDERWMESLGGEVVDERRSSEGPSRITQHPASGTWGATLGNGIRVWARGMDADDRVSIAAMIWGDLFVDGSISEAEIDAAMLAWEKASTERRDAGWIAVFQEEHGIDVRARRVVGGIRLMIDAPAGSSERALELMYALLDRPMIDADAFARWDTKRPVRLGDQDPLDRAFAMMYHPELLEHESEAISLDHAQRVLTRIVQEAWIEIGVAGAIEAASTIERVSGLMGMLSERVTHGSSEEVAPMPAGVHLKGETRVEGEHRTIAFGVRGGSLDDLDGLRAMILASEVLDQRLRDWASMLGDDRVRVRADVAMSDGLGDRWALIVSIRGDDPSAYEADIREMVVQIAIDGMDPETFAEAQSELVASIDKYFGQAWYWSTRLSGLGVHDRSVDDAWGVRTGYSSVDADVASRVYQDAIEQGEWFRVEIEPGAR